MANTKDAAYLLSKARVQLIMNQPFFGSLSTKLRLVERNDMPTLATDGVHLFYNSDYVQRICAEPRGMNKLQGLVCHETMHCAMLHMTRFIGAKDEDTMRRLVACDWAINPIIRECSAQMSHADKLELPSDAVYPDVTPNPNLMNLPLAPLNESAEFYFNFLKQWQQSVNKAMQQAMSGHHCAGIMDMPGSADGDGDGDGDEDGNGKGKPQPQQGKGKGGGNKPTPAEIAQAESQWKIAVMQAAQTAKAAGKLPAGLERLIDEIHEPYVDWKDVLRRFVSEQSKDDYRLFPPNRRFVWSGTYLPSLNSTDAVGEIVIAVDTSGSIGNAELSAFFSEINGVCEDARPKRVHVIGCDAAVGSHEEFEPVDYPIKPFNLKGGGGTNFIPVFDYVEEHGIEPVCLIYLTDMYGTGWPTEAQAPYPVLWVATSDVIAPIGDTIRLQLDGR